MGVFRRFGTTTGCTTISGSGLSQSDIIALIDERTSGAAGSTHDVETRIIAADLTLPATGRFFQFISKGGVARTVTVPVGTSNWIKNEDSGILTVKNSAGATVASLLPGESSLVLWDVQSLAHYRINNLLTAGSSSVGYFPFDVTGGSGTLNFAPSDGDLAYVHRRDLTNTGNSVTIDLTSVPGLTFEHPQLLAGLTTLTVSTGSLFLFKRVGSVVRMLLPESLTSLSSPVVREALLVFTLANIAGTTIFVNVGGGGVTYTGSTTFNLGTSSVVFNASTLLRFLLNGVELVNGVDVQWVSATSFMLTSHSLSIGDSVSVKELKF